MSSKVKERLKQLALEMTHEQRLELDATLDKIAMANGVILVNEERGCDVLIEHIPDDQLKEIVARIKKKKKRAIEIQAEAN